MIKPIPKAKKKKNQTVGYWSKKADKVMQEIGRNMYDKCLICGREYSCLHHYFPKSTSTSLRYDWENLIPICVGCHNRHHSASDPRIHSAVIRIKGDDWNKELEIKARKSDGIIGNYTWYRDRYEELKKILEKYV